MKVFLEIWILMTKQKVGMTDTKYFLKFKIKTKKEREPVHNILPLKCLVALLSV